MNFVKYLENYEESGQTVTINLKDYPSSKINGRIISREILYELGFKPNELMEINKLSFKWSV